MATEDYSVSKLGDDDLLVEILIRLPHPKIAFRCKSVCKRWNSLIFAPYFSRRFVSHCRALSAAAAEPPLLTPSDFRELVCSFLPMPSDKIRSRCFAFDCFKDLLLVGFENRYTSNDELGRTYFICNPFTRQWVCLPLAPGRSCRWYVTTRLVCEPCNSISLDMGGEGIEKSFTHDSEYRFCVVRLCDNRVDVFSSKSGRWNALRLDHGSRLAPYYWSSNNKIAVSHNGKLYWKNRQREVVQWNPFRPRDDPTFIAAPDQVDHYHSSIWASQGALHIIDLLKENGHQRDAVRVWRWEEEGWRTDYEVLLNKLALRIGRRRQIKVSEIYGLNVVGHHPERSEIVFLRGMLPRSDDFVVFSCNLKSEELEVVAYNGLWSRQDTKMLQFKVSLWPTLIPSYTKLQAAYDGRYTCWLQRNNHLASRIQVHSRNNS